MPLKLRPATPEDAPALTDILHRAKASFSDNANSATPSREDRRISEATIASLHMTVAEKRGTAVAFSGLTVRDGDTLQVDYLVVPPEARGQGIGALLLARAEEHARWRNLSRLFLNSDADAAGFYEKNGFRTLSKRPGPTGAGKDVLNMEKPLPPSVHEISSLDISVSTATWAFEEAYAGEIATHFDEARKRIPFLWNGRTLKLTGYSFENGIFRGNCSECSYAAYLAWRDWGAPDISAHNLFGSAILRSGDGALLYGVMAKHTATAGLIYPPGGNLDPEDRTADGKVDVVGAIYRELEEETGLTPADVRPAGLLVAFDGPRISIAQVLDCDRPAERLREEIIRHSRASKDQELEDIQIVRSREDLNNPAIVPFARAVADRLLTETAPGG